MVSSHEKEYHKEMDCLSEETAQSSLGSGHNQNAFILSSPAPLSRHTRVLQCIMLSLLAAKVHWLCSIRYRSWKLPNGVNNPTNGGILNTDWMLAMREATAGFCFTSVFRKYLPHLIQHHGIEFTSMKISYFCVSSLQGTHAEAPLKQHFYWKSPILTHYFWHSVCNQNSLAFPQGQGTGSPRENHAVKLLASVWSQQAPAAQQKAHGTAHKVRGTLDSKWKWIWPWTMTDLKNLSRSFGQRKNFQEIRYLLEGKKMFILDLIYWFYSSCFEKNRWAEKNSYLLITKLKFPEKSKKGRQYSPTSKEVWKVICRSQCIRTKLLFYNSKFIRKQNIQPMSNTRGHQSTFLGPKDSPLQL